MAANARKRRAKDGSPPPPGPESTSAAAPPPGGGSEGPLLIKKYANRRFYDFSRSRHLTLAEIHDLIVNGQEVRISDATTGQDITNAILTQIILENEAPKLDFFPPNILHQIIRTQRQYLGGVMDSFFQTWLNTQRQSQQRWMELMQSMFGGGAFNPATGQHGAPSGQPGSPLDWTRQMFSMWMPNAHRDNAPPTSESPATPNNNEREISELRARLAELSSRLEHLQRASG